MAANAPMQNLIFHKDATSASDGVTYSVSSNASTLSIDFMATEGTTFVAHFEGKIVEESDWDSVSAFNLNTLNVATTSETTDTWQLDLTAWSYVRVRLSSVTGGSVSVYAKAVG